MLRRYVFGWIGTRQFAGGFGRGPRLGIIFFIHIYKFIDCRFKKYQPLSSTYRTSILTSLFNSREQPIPYPCPLIPFYFTNRKPKIRKLPPISSAGGISESVCLFVYAFMLNRYTIFVEQNNFCLHKFERGRRGFSVLISQLRASIVLPTLQIFLIKQFW